MAKQKDNRRQYLDPDTREPVPGVTTVIGDTLGWSKGALIGWAHKLGREGRSLSERDQAADKGTATHALSWSMLGHDDGTELDERERAEHENNAKRIVECIRARWEVVHVELPIVVKGFGGTIDLICRNAKGEHGIVDLKTGKGVYDEVAIQLGAYAGLWDMRCGTENTDRHARFASIIHAHPGSPLAVVDVPMESVNAGSAAFVHLLAIYKMKKRIKVKL